MNCIRQGGIQVRRVSKQHIGVLARDQALMGKYERMAAGLAVLKLAGDPDCWVPMAVAKLYAGPARRWCGRSELIEQYETRGFEIERIAQAP